MALRHVGKEGDAVMNMRPMKVSQNNEFVDYFKIKIMNSFFHREYHSSELIVSSFEVFSQILALHGPNFLRWRFRRSKCVSLSNGCGCAMS